MSDKNTMDSELPILKNKLIQQLSFIYKDVKLNIDFKSLSDELIQLMRLDKVCHTPVCYENHWSEQDVIMITYGDSVIKAHEKPLVTLHDFINRYLQKSINSVHILPFFPYSSDDGFSVIDYSSVNEGLGDWQDIQTIAKNKRLMSDLVINHCSSRSAWFENFIRGEGPGHDFFYTTSPDVDVSKSLDREPRVY